jgi:hypothetical protein
VAAAVRTRPGAWEELVASRECSARRVAVLAHLHGSGRTAAYHHSGRGVRPVGILG